MLYVIKETVKDNLTGYQKTINSFESVGTLLATQMVAQQYKRHVQSDLSIQTEYGKVLSRRKFGSKGWNNLY